jgi:hypothetical protein
VAAGPMRPRSSHEKASKSEDFNFHMVLPIENFFLKGFLDKAFELNNILQRISLRSMSIASHSQAFMW